MSTYSSARLHQCVALLSHIVSLLSLLPLLLFVCQSPTSAAPSDPSYLLVWSDEFSLPNQSSPDPAFWAHEVGPGAEIGGNHELEYYTASLNNSFVQAGVLNVQSLWQPSAHPNANITSARLNSINKVELYLGYVEARIRVLTMADGHWPAFWMLGHCSEPYPNCGEIDIMEQVNGPVGNTHGSDKQQCGTLWSNPAGINGSTPTGSYHHAGGCVDVAADEKQWGDFWHVYAMQWNESAIDFLVDGVTYSSSAFGGDVGFDCYTTSTDPYYLIINLAEGGDNPGVAPVEAAFPTQLQVDWVRVWQRNDGRSYIIAPNTTALPEVSTGTSSTGSSSGGSSSSISGSSSSGASSGSSTSSELPFSNSVSSSGSDSVGSTIGSLIMSSSSTSGSSSTGQMATNGASKCLLNQLLWPIVLGLYVVLRS